MKFRILHVSLVLILSTSLVAQIQGSGGGKPSGPTSGTAPTIGSSTTNPSTPALNNQGPFFLTGKVRIDDGTVLTDEPVIKSTCHSQVRTEGYTDFRGNFSFTIGSHSDTKIPWAGEASDTAGFAPVGNPRGSVTDKWRDCELQAVLPGFTSQVVQVGPHLVDYPHVDVGTIVLHRQIQVQGYTVSATNSAVPSKAMKEYEKGRELVKKQKWDQAIDKFKKAVEVYPQYAVAWFEMGRAQEHNTDITEARRSFRQAIAVDPKFVSPYQELARMAFRDGQWQEAADTTAEVLKLNAVNFPQEWLFNASANYYLKRLDVAEQSAWKGLQADTQHQVPQLEHLLGVILAQKKNYRGALEHLNNYLASAPNADDADLARKQVQQLERLSAQVTSR